VIDFKEAILGMPEPTINEDGFDLSGRAKDQSIRINAEEINQPTRWILACLGGLVRHNARAPSQGGCRTGTGRPVLGGAGDLVVCEQRGHRGSNLASLFLAKNCKPHAPRNFLYRSARDDSSNRCFVKVKIALQMLAG
jgi:hypothetical protein